MVGWHHQLNGHEFGWTPGVGGGQRGLACWRSWGQKESDTTKRLNWTELGPKFFRLHTHWNPSNPIKRVKNACWQVRTEAVEVRPSVQGHVPEQGANTGLLHLCAPHWAVRHQCDAVPSLQTTGESSQKTLERVFSSLKWGARLPQPCDWQILLSSFPVVSATLLLGQTAHPPERPKTNTGLSHLLHPPPQPGSICWETTAGFLWSPSWGHRLPPRHWAPLLLQGATCTSWTQVTSAKVWVTWGMNFLEKEVPRRLTFLNSLSKSMRTLLGDSFRVLPAQVRKLSPPILLLPQVPCLKELLEGPNDWFTPVCRNLFTLCYFFLQKRLSLIKQMYSLKRDSNDTEVHSSQIGRKRGRKEVQASFLNHILQR